MKKEIVTMMAAAAVLVGCNQADQSANEPAGADRPMDRSTNSFSTNTWSTNTISEPSGATRDSSSFSTNSESGTAYPQQDSATQETNSQPQSVTP